MKPRKLNFVLGNGRCGSNLLSAILQECGANFGVLEHEKVRSDDYWVEQEKKRIGGYMEDPKLGRALSYMKKYYELRKHLPFLPVFLIDWLKKKSARQFKKAINDERDWVLHNIILNFLDDLRELLNIQPKVLGIVRHPVEQMGGFYTGFGSFVRENGATEIYKRYFDNNMRLLSHIDKYGGCLICFDDVMNKEKTNWAKTISKAFPNFKEKDLLDAREKVVDDRSRNTGKKESYYLPEDINKFWEFLVKKTKEN